MHTYLIRDGPNRPTESLSSGSQVGSRELTEEQIKQLDKIQDPISKDNKFYFPDFKAYEKLISQKQRLINDQRIHESIWIYNITMEQLFEHLERFSASPLCVFEFKPMDYPSDIQQHLITAYFELATLIKTTAHPDIVRILHSSTDKQHEIFLPGLLYALLLDFKANHHIFETYMPILRSESWLGFDRLLQQLIRESLNFIKWQHRQALVLILGRLNYFGQLTPDLLALAIKTADAFDFSEPSLNYNNSLLEFFQSILAQGAQGDHLKAVLCDRLFYKLMRMMTLLNMVDDENLREYRSRCVAIAYRLLAFGKQRCLAMGWGASGVMRELQNDESMVKLLEQCREELLRSPPPPENPALASMRLGMVLPIRIEAALHFIISEELSQVEVGVQMGWALGKKEDHFQLLQIDILRYILALPPQELPHRQGICLLEWLFYRSCNNNILFQFWKSQLFHPCFCDPCPYPAAPERALRFLAYLLHNNFDFGETLLVYLLRQMSVPGSAKRLRQLLIQANTLKIIDIQWLLSHSRMSPRAKAELRAAIGDSSVQDVERFKQEEAQQYYNPLEEIQRKDSQIEVEFSPSESSEHFEGYDEPEESMEVEPSEQRGMRVKVEKMFAEDLGENLSHLMLQPSIANYKQFFRRLMDEIKAFKVSGEVETIELFISQTAKITYLLFQSHFQDHIVPVSKDESVIVNLLGIVTAEWRTNSLAGQCSKKIIRKVIDYFPTAEAGIWRQFLLYFRRGVVAQARELKDWLIPKEKAEYAIPLLKELGPINKELIDNAEQLKLPLC